MAQERETSGQRFLSIHNKIERIESRRRRLKESGGGIFIGGGIGVLFDAGLDSLDGKFGNIDYKPALIIGAIGIISYIIGAIKPRSLKRLKKQEKEFIGDDIGLIFTSILNPLEAAKILDQRELTSGNIIEGAAIKVTQD
jgi:hypothetical protein